MENNKKEFKKVCDKFIELYLDTFEEKITVDDIIDEVKFKKIYRRLAKVYHTDLNHNNKVTMKEINDLRDKLKDLLDDPRLISSIIEMNDDEYRKYMIGRLKEKKEEYKSIWASFEEEVEDFESLILFKKTKGDMDALYYDFIKQLDIKLKKEIFLKQKISFLRGFVDNRNQENVELFHEFLNKTEKCNNIGDVAELCQSYETILRKNALVFLAKDSLTRLCAGYQDDEMEKMVINASNSVRFIEYSDEDAFMKIFIDCSNKINLRKQILDNYKELSSLMLKNSRANFEGVDIGVLFNSKNMQQLKIYYDALKETITSRIDYHKRVCAKIGGFLNKCKKDSANSFTYPFIVNKVKELYSYYDPSDKDLRKFGRLIKKLEKEIEIQRNNDQKLANEKKSRLYDKFMADYDAGILHASGKRFLESDLENITTFGGFADFENKVIKMDVSNILADVFRYLHMSVERLENTPNVSNKGKRKHLVNRAIYLAECFYKIYNNTKDFSKIKISKSFIVDYKEFSITLQILNNIDFVLEDINEIEKKISNLNEFLHRDLYDEQLIKMVGSRKK